MTLSRRHLRLLALALVVGLAFTATLVWAAPGVSLVDPPRTGYDPLSPEEQEQARALAVQQGEFAIAVNAASRSELLLIEHRRDYDVLAEVLAVLDEALVGVGFPAR